MNIYEENFIYYAINMSDTFNHIEYISAYISAYEIVKKHLDAIDDDDMQFYNFSDEPKTIYLRFALDYYKLEDCSYKKSFIKSLILKTKRTYKINKLLEI